MMDGSSIFPSGFHPSSQNSLPDLRGDAIPMRRSDAKNIKYFFIDFSLASFFEDGKEPRRVVGRVGEDTLAPELSDDVPYDPFPVDVYILGDVIRKTFLEVYILFRHITTEKADKISKKYSNLTFLRPLTEAMMLCDPNGRPSAPEALDQFRTILLERNASHDRRLARNDELSITRVILDAQFLLRKATITPTTQ